MNGYIVLTSEGRQYTIKAQDFEVDGDGELNFTSNGKKAATFSRGTWNAVWLDSALIAAS
jgi:hypothetical protein